MNGKLCTGLYQGKPVALKVLRGKMDEQKLETFKKEFAIVRYTCQFHILVTFRYSRKLSTLSGRYFIRKAKYIPNML
jgi:hypothetical protein